MYKQSDEVVASLIIYGYEDLSELSKLLALVPDKTLQRGEVVRPGSAPLKRSYWSFKSNLPKNATPEEHVKWLIEQIRPHKGELSKIALNYKTQISVGAHFYDFNPEMVFDPALTKELGEMGVRLWLDIYYFQPTYFEEKAQIKEFDSRLKDIKPGVENIGNALSIIEQENSLVSSSLDDLALVENENDLDESLEKLLMRIHNINKVIQESKYLSDKLDSLNR